MAKAPVNLAASVKDRLLRLARKERQPFDVLLVRFALERLLYRLSLSPLRDQFILKGGLLVTLWLEDDNRVTRDADGADVGVGGAGQPDAAHRGGGEHEPARATDDGQGHQRQRGIGVVQLEAAGHP